MNALNETHGFSSCKIILLITNINIKSCKSIHPPAAEAKRKVGEYTVWKTLKNSFSSSPYGHNCRLSTSVSPLCHTNPLLVLHYIHEAPLLLRPGTFTFNILHLKISSIRPVNTSKPFQLRLFSFISKLPCLS